MSSGQVCRPHFHAPIHPWLSDSKPLNHPSHPWVPFGGGDPDKSQSPSSVPVSQPHNLFSFPPTPPKDSTPDSIAPAGGQEYQSVVAAAMGAFMHENQQSCALDIKPSVGGGGGGGAAASNKQREGSDYEGTSTGMFNGNFESSYGSAYGHGIHGAVYSPQKQQFTGQGAQSPNKPRNKSRTSAGKRVSREFDDRFTELTKINPQTTRVGITFIFWNIILNFRLSSFNRFDLFEFIHAVIANGNSSFNEDIAFGATRARISIFNNAIRLCFVFIILFKISLRLCWYLTLLSHVENQSSVNSFPASCALPTQTKNKIERKWPIYSDAIPSIRWRWWRNPGGRQGPFCPHV